MFSGKKIASIIKNKSGQEAIIEIDNLLSPILYSNPESLTSAEKDIAYIEQLEMDVNNGGFDQFFENSAGDYTAEIINALKQIDSKIFLKLVERAVEVFPNSVVPKDREKRQKILESIPEKEKALWDELNNEFFNYEEDICTLMINYIEKNIKDFR